MMNKRQGLRKSIIRSAHHAFPVLHCALCSWQADTNAAHLMQAAQHWLHAVSIWCWAFHSPQSLQPLAFCAWYPCNELQPRKTCMLFCQHARFRLPQTAFLQVKEMEAHVGVESAQVKRDVLGTARYALIACSLLVKTALVLHIATVKHALSCLMLGWAHPAYADSCIAPELPFIDTPLAGQVSPSIKHVHCSLIISRRGTVLLC